MKHLARSAGLLLIIVLIWQQPILSYVKDALDHRPEVKILFIGNSRTSLFNIPGMMRVIADSAGASHKYNIHMYTRGGKGMLDHLNDPNVAQLMRERWDFVVMHGGTTEYTNKGRRQAFKYYGAKLIDLVRRNGSTPLLLVTWRYGDNYPLFEREPQLHKDIYKFTQDSYAELGKYAHTKRINVGKVWEKVETSSPGFSLYMPDANHQSIYGAYLTALVLYRYFSQDDLKKVTYKPAAISLEDADFLKKAAMEK